MRWILIAALSVLFTLSSCYYNEEDEIHIHTDFWRYGNDQPQADFQEFPVEGKWISTDQYDPNWVDATLYIGYDYHYVNEKSQTWYDTGSWTISFNKITFMGGGTYYTGTIWEISKDRLVIDYNGTGKYYKRVYYRRIY